MVQNKLVTWLAIQYTEGINVSFHKYSVLCQKIHSHDIKIVCLCCYVIFQYLLHIYCSSCLSLVLFDEMFIIIVCVHVYL